MIAFAHASTPAALEQLGEEIAELAAHLHSATYRLLVRLREFDERDGWSGGFTSCARWLSWRTGIAPGAAREKVRVARALGDLPLLSVAMERGEMSFSKVRALTRIATSHNEEELLELARHATAAQVERIVRAWRRLDRQAEADAERERHETRHLSLHADENGSYVLRGRLDPEVGVLLERALDAAAKTLYDEDQLPAAADGELPTAAQRRADAIGLLVELALQSHGLSAAGTVENPPGQPANSDDDHPDVESPIRPPMRSLGRAGRVHVVLHVHAETLRADGGTGQSVLDGGVRVSAETSRRLACDASMVTMSHDANGTVLDVGRRTRTIPPAIRRALEHRDRGCRFPGCGNRYVDAHHLQHWADGGATRLDNLVLLCRRHHRLVHEDGYRVCSLASGDLMFTRPDGRVIPHAPSTAPGACECPSDHHLRTITTAAGQAHARLDLGWALQVFYRR